MESVSQTDADMLGVMEDENIEEAELVESFEDGTLQTEPEPQEPEHEELVGQGEADPQLSFDVGGKRPTESTLKVSGASIDLGSEQLENGQSIGLTLVVRVGEVHFKHQTDPDTDRVIGCERIHKAKATDWVVDWAEPTGA